MRLYGYGYFLQFLGISVPVSENHHVRLAASARAICDGHRTMEGLDYPFWPEPGGLLPFGSTDNADFLFWLMRGPPGDWAVVVWGRAFNSFEVFDCDMTSFLAGLATGEILPKEFPDDLLPCERPFMPSPVDTQRASASQWRLKFTVSIQGEKWR